MVGEPALADEVTAQLYAPLYSNAPWLTLLAAVILWRRRTPPMVSRPMWRGSVRRLLATRSWRETPVRVLNTRCTVLVLPDGEYLRVSRLPAAVREVAVWAGRVWLVGPDDDGRLAVRVDGLSAVWSARRIPPMPGTAALPTGTWTQAEAAAPSWQARRNGLADGTVTLSFPDGRRSAVQLDRAPLDLFANVVREKSLWVAQNGVVGYPHYPIAATARFTPA